MGPPVRSKKMAISEPPRKYPAPTGHIQRKMVRIELMADRIFRLDRRELMAGLGGLGAAALGPAMPDIAAAQGRSSLTLQAKAGTLAAASGTGGYTDMVASRTRRQTPLFASNAATRLEISVQNELPVPAMLNWHGIDGVPAAEPLAARSPCPRAARKT